MFHVCIYIHNYIRVLYAYIFISYHIIIYYVCTLYILVLLYRFIVCKGNSREFYSYNWPVSWIAKVFTFRKNDRSRPPFQVPH